MKAELTDKKLKWSLLFIGIVTLFINHQFFFYGYFGFDDMHYAKLSHSLLEGQMDFNDHYSYRWTILGLTALSYKILGINDFSSALPSILLTSASLFLIFKHLKSQPSAILLIATALFFSVRWNLFYSDKLMPDIYLGFFALAAWLSYLNRKKKPLCSSALFTISLFLGFLAKGTIILASPLLVFYMIMDIRNKDFRFWKYAIGIGLLIFGAYFTLMGHLTGDIFARFSTISKNEYFNECSYNLMPIEATLERISSGFLSLIFREGLFYFLLIGLLPKIGKIIDWQPLKKKKIQFYSNTILIWFLSMNFMTISLSSYNPTCLDIRHYLLSVPILCICSAMIIEPIYLKCNKGLQWLIILLSFLLIIPSVRHAYQSRKMHFNEIKKEIRVVANNDTYTDEHPIISNQVLVNFLRYYSDFEKNDAFVSNKEIRKGAHIVSTYDVVSNWYTEHQSNNNLPDICSDLNIKPSQLVKNEHLNRGYKRLVFWEQK